MSRIARGEVDQSVESLAFRRRCDDGDQVEAELVAGRPKVTGLLDRQVDDDEAVDAGLGRPLDERSRARVSGPVAPAELVDEVVVGHADDRHGGVELLDELEVAFGSHPALQRTDDRTLNRRALGDGFGERQPEFQHEDS